jgi:hypothetical protein
MSDFDTILDSIAAHTTSTTNSNSNKYATADYQYGADSHNYGNSNWAVTDPSTWGTAAGNGVKMTISAAASGLNGFYNTGVTVGNWFGADLKENDVATQLGWLDSNLGEYYQQNRQSADLAGFMVTSLIPGLGGVKLLNAGQRVLRGAAETGMIGGNLAKATGLLTPTVDAYRTLAAADIATSAATFSATSVNTLKAIRAGYGQAALESAAFEIAVAATTFKSPTLSEADGWDIAKNIAIGTVLGGAIGGAITHAVTSGGIKRAVKELNPAEKLFTNTSDITGLNAAQSIVARQDRLVTMPAAPTVEAIMDGSFVQAQGLVKNLAAKDMVGVSEQLATKFNRMRSETADALNFANRNDFNTLAKGDAELGNQIADMHQGMSSNQSFASMTHVTSFGRIADVLPQELELARHAKLAIKEAEKAVTGGIENAIITPAPYKIGFLKLSGDGAGNVSFEAPKILSLADTLPNKTAVMDKIKSYGFNESKVYSAIESKGGHLEAEARFQWADRTAITKEGMSIGSHDIPLLEKAVSDKVGSIVVKTSDGTIALNSTKEISEYLQSAKTEVIEELVARSSVAPVAERLTTEEIGKIANVKSSYIEGVLDIEHPERDFLARQMHKSDYIKYLEDNKIPRADMKANDFGLSPTYTKVAYDTKVAMADGYELAGMAYIKAQQKLYQQSVDNIFAAYMPDDLAAQFWHAGDEVMLTTNRYGSGPGITSFANGGYHTAESWAESIGGATSRLQKHYKDATSEMLQGSLYKLKSNQNAAIEFESINKEIQSSTHNYGINEARTGIEPLDLIDYKAAIAAGKKAKEPVFEEGTKLFIPIKNVEAMEAWTARTELTSNRTTAFQDIRNAQGLEDMKDARALRPIRPDPKDYPFFAIVVDEKITGVGHKSMIHAASASELDGLIAKVPTKFTVIKKTESEAFHKAIGDFDYSQTLHENYIDTALKRTGANNPFFIRTDPQAIAENILKDHLRSDDIFARELVNAKYEKEFSFLRQQGEQYTSTASSKYTGSFREIENTVKNPYTNYAKTALNISQVSEHPYIMGLNNKLDAAVSKGWKLIDDAWNGARTPEELTKVNQALEEFGVSSAYRDSALDLLANHSAPKGVLTKFVGQANSIISTLVTRLDPFNAVNNVVGSTVLYGTEVKSFLKAMGNDNQELAGKLAGLLKTPAPLMDTTTVKGLENLAASGAQPDQVTNAGKLLMNATKNFFNKEAKTLDGKLLKDYYKANGWSTRLHDQFHSVMENLTLVGTEDASLMNSKIKSAFTAAKELADKGEKYTGNKFAEEFNRFVSADTMRQLTDLGVQAGKITSDEARGYINTFVNRTQGNVLASQRPLMFQGPIGQAIGLFQTFQFNTMQQLFRHVAEGAPKDAAMLLGLQGTMYGMNGLPGFNFLNTHIVGTLSGNPEHRDAYSATYGIAGKSIGDLVLYGLPSNLLRGNLYSRGDINPRSLTVVPSNPADIPFVSAATKLYTNARDALTKVENGGSIWQSLLQGIEHNGLSRPLAGLAQVTQGLTHEGNVYSTTSKGNISGANDLMSWGTAVRLAGGKPLDESIVNDATFRITSYVARDRLKMDELNKAVKSSVIGGGVPSADQMNTFSEKYASLGGKQKNFNKYMLLQMKTANTTKANEIANNLKNPYSTKMQEIMGGTGMTDGNSF